MILAMLHVSLPRGAFVNRGANLLRIVRRNRPGSDRRF